MEVELKTSITQLDNTKESLTSWLDQMVNGILGLKDKVDEPEQTNIVWKIFKSIGKYLQIILF